MRTLPQSESGPDYQDNVTKAKSNSYSKARSMVQVIVSHYDGACYSCTACMIRRFIMLGARRLRVCTKFYEIPQDMPGLGVALIQQVT
jgi:hypothetical protein